MNPSWEHPWDSCCRTDLAHEPFLLKKRFQRRMVKLWGALMFCALIGVWAGMLGNSFLLYWLSFTHFTEDKVLCRPCKLETWGSFASSSRSGLLPNTQVALARCLHTSLYKQYIPEVLALVFPYPHLGPHLSLSQGWMGPDLAGTSEVVDVYFPSPTSAEGGRWGRWQREREGERQTVYLWDLKREAITF